MSDVCALLLWVILPVVLVLYVLIKEGEENKTRKKKWSFFKELLRGFGDFWMLVQMFFSSIFISLPRSLFWHWKTHPGMMLVLTACYLFMPWCFLPLLGHFLVNRNIFAITRGRSTLQQFRVIGEPYYTDNTPDPDWFLKLPTVNKNTTIV